VAQPDPGRRENADSRPGETFSLFVTRVLDQLSISSWLPAIMVVCNLAFIFQLRSQHNFDIGQAITSLTAKPLGILIVLLLSIIVTSVMTQAFEFEIIRLFEGYWGSPNLLNGLSKMRTNRHAKRLEWLKKRYQAYFRQAFIQAREEMLDKKVERDVVEILDKQRRGEPVDNHDSARVAAATQLGWERFASPDLLRRMNAIDSRIKEYPSPHRILPTRLGNTLRSSEDRLHLEPHEILEDFVRNRYEQMNPELKIKHDESRSRLNIYCMLAFIFSALAIVSPVVLVHRGTDLAGGVTFTVVYVILAVVSYQAAITSTRNYISVLRAIDSRSSPGGQAKIARPS
jgi:hypothetical protein